MKRSWMLILLPSFLPACANHPLPEDYSGAYTLNIVQSIRCEAREGVALAIAGIIEDKNEEDYQTAEMQAVARSLRKDRNLSDLDRSKLHPKLQALLNRLDHAAIIYDFRLAMTEKNDNSVSSTLRDPLSNGVLGIDFGAGSILTRKNQRRFRVVDIFSEYYDKRGLGRTCGRPVSQLRRSNNPFYPLAGRIGLAEVLQTYLLLVETAGLSKTIPAIEAAVAPSFIETLTFTTEIKGNISPTIELMSLSRLPYISKAGGIFSANRTDEHEVTIALSLDPKGRLGDDRLPGEEVRDTLYDLDRQQLLDALGARSGF